MTIFLISIIWIGYGAFAASQTDEIDDEKLPALYSIYILFSPLVFFI